MEKLPRIVNCIRRLNTATVSQVLSTCSRSNHPLQYVQHRQAGHSHWQNIRHIKGAKDQAKSMISQRIAARLRVALRETGGSNPKVNSKLAKVIQDAEDSNIPSKSIQAMITKAESVKMTFKCYEAKGPNGSLIIFNISTPNFRKTKNELNRILFKRCGGALMTEGGTRNHFDTKGIVIAVSKNEEPMSLEEATDIAILVNAEDVKKGKTENDVECFEVICEPDAIYDVVKGLNDTPLQVEDYNLVPIPHDLVELSATDKALIEKTVEVVRGLEDIVVEQVYDNINW